MSWRSWQPFSRSASARRSFRRMGEQRLWLVWPMACQEEGLPGRRYYSVLRTHDERWKTFRLQEQLVDIDILCRTDAVSSVERVLRPDGGEVGVLPHPAWA